MPLHLCKSRYDFIELMYEGTTNISYTDYANFISPPGSVIERGTLYSYWREIYYRLSEGTES